MYSIRGNAHPMCNVHASTVPVQYVTRVLRVNSAGCVLYMFSFWREIFQQVAVFYIEQTKNETSQMHARNWGYFFPGTGSCLAVEVDNVHDDEAYDLPSPSIARY